MFRSYRFETDKDPDKEPIATISDTPAPDVNPAEIEKAEDATKEETEARKEHAEEKATEEVSETELDEAIGEDEDTEGEDPSTLRYTKRYKNIDGKTVPLSFLENCMLEYGTPAGIDVIDEGSCQDAGDVAIIDSEIQPAEGTQDEEEDKEETTFEASDDENPAEEFEMYYQCTMQYEAAIGRENFFDILKTIGSKLLSICSKLSFKIIKYIRKTLLFGKKKLLNVMLHKQNIMKLWKFKISRNINNIDYDRVMEYEVESYPYELWSKLASLSIQLFDVISDTKKLVTDPESNYSKHRLKDLNERLKNMGVEVDLLSNKISIAELTDSRKLQSLRDHGFTKAVLPNTINYMIEVSKRIPNGSLNHIEKTLQEATELILHSSAKFSQMVEDGYITKNSVEYKKGIESIIDKTAMMNLVTNCQKISYILFDQLIKDAEKVFSKYEDGMTYEKIV